MRNKSMALPCSPYREWPLTHSTCAFQTGCPPSRWASEMRILRSIARACRRHDSKSVVVKLAIRRTTRKAMRHRTCWTDRWRATRTQKCTSLFGILLGKHSHASTTIGTCCPFRLRIDPPSTNCTMPPYRKRWVNTRTYRSCTFVLQLCPKRRFKSNDTVDTCHAHSEYDRYYYYYVGQTADRIN